MLIEMGKGVGKLKRLSATNVMRYENFARGIKGIIVLCDFHGAIMLILTQ